MHAGRKHRHLSRGALFFLSAALLFAGIPYVFPQGELAPWSMPGSVSLAWNQDYVGVDGYLLQYGIGSRSYSWALNCGTNLQARIQNLPGGFTWYFTISAYWISRGTNAAGRMVTNYVTSPPSPEISTNLPPVDGEPQLVITNGVCLVNAFSSSPAAELQSSPDLRHWQTVATAPVLYLTAATNNQFFRLKLGGM